MHRLLRAPGTAAAIDLLLVYFLYHVPVKVNDREKKATHYYKTPQLHPLIKKSTVMKVPIYECCMYRVY